MTQLPTGLPDGASKDREAVSFPRPLAKVLLQIRISLFRKKGLSELERYPRVEQLSDQTRCCKKGFGNVGTKRGQEINVPVPVYAVILAVRVAGDFYFYL